MTILIKAAQLLCSLSLLVVLHEFGHYFAARAFGVRVDKFYLFFDMGFALFRKKIGQTEWGIGWLPLGGYAKIHGMVDESLDREGLKQPPQPDEFRAQAAWKRLIIILGGIIMNLITAWVIYSALMWSEGAGYLPTNEIRYGIVADSLMSDIGFKDGDRLRYVNSREYEDYADFSMAALLSPGAIVTVEREWKPVDVQLSKVYLPELLKRDPLFEFRFPLTIAGVMSHSAAEAAGFQVGDSLVSLNGAPSLFFDQFYRCVRAHVNDTIQVGVMRAGQPITLNVVVPDSAIVGIVPDTHLQRHFQIATYNYSVLEAIGGGAKRVTNTFAQYARSLKLLFVPEAKAHQSIGGFISIGRIFPSQWDWHAFWSLTAFLSLILAVMNLLPIPALDGGHALLIIIELLTGKRLGTRVLVTLQLVGMVLLFALLIFANVNDIVRLLQ